MSEYWCLWCGRRLEGEPIHNDEGELVGWVFVHDDIPHSADATFDEEERPQ